MMMQKTKDLETVWLTTSELMTYTKLSRGKAVRFANEAGAVKRISTRKNLYSKALIDLALNRL